MGAGLRQLCWYGVTLIALLALGARIGANAIPLGMVAGLAIYCAVLVTGTRGVFAGVGGDDGRPDPGLEPPAGLVLLPLVLASAANYVNIGVERGIAARLPEGSLAALTYAFRLLHFPVNLLVLMNATSILFPALAEHAAQRRGRRSWRRFCGALCG